jgi:diguanylate cyclase (GGDEF)-like protein
MVESDPPDQGSSSGGTRDPRRDGRAGFDASTAAQEWLGRWRERLQGDRFPEDEARLVVDALLEELGGGRPEALDRAGRAWGRAHRSVSAMVGRLSVLRETLAAGGVDDALRMHRDLDRVTASATEEVLNRLERASRTDALTGVGNRRAFDETLSAALSAAARQGHEVTVVAVDLDGLKRINDSEGHAAGDAALLALVRAFYTALRDEDTVFRVGGDEFVILLPFTSVDAAELLMERVVRGGAPSFTWGAAGYPGAGADALGLVEAADRNLYRRREDRRTPVVAATLARAGQPRGRTLRERLRPNWRWAWVPASAVLLVSLVATLVSSGSPLSQLSAKGKGHPRATVPRHSVSLPGAKSVPPRTSAAGGSTSSSGTVTTGYLTASYPTAASGPANSSPAGQSGTSPTSPSSPPPSGGGLLGVLDSLLAPVPVVGGSNGLVSDVGQLLTGSPITVTGAGSSSPASANSATDPATRTQASLLSSLLG